MSSLLTRPDLILARDAFRVSATYSVKWDNLVAESIKRYGARPQGGHISGIYSDHFPKLLQDTLRDIAHSVTRHSNEAYALRPKRVRLATMQALRLAVRAKYGAGYYG